MMEGGGGEERPADQTGPPPHHQTGGNWPPTSDCRTLRGNTLTRSAWAPLTTTTHPVEQYTKFISGLLLQGLNTFFPSTSKSLLRPCHRSMCDLWTCYFQLILTTISASQLLISLQSSIHNPPLHTVCVFQTFLHPTEQKTFPFTSYLCFCN